MNKRLSLFLACLCLATVASASVDELSVARQALRDGLWEVARTHAEKMEGDEAKIIILESYCREARWEEALKELNSWAALESPEFAYYRALILFKTKRYTEASSVFSSVDFKEGPFVLLAARLKAQLALALGQTDEALRLMKESGFAQANDIESRLDAANIFMTAGDVKSAEVLWRAVSVDTNATEHAFAVAALNLSDSELLRKAYAQTKQAKLRRTVGLRLGEKLLKDNQTFQEGVSLIRALTKDAPDADGASDAFVALADAFLTVKRYQEALDTFQQALEVWPQLAQVFRVHEGRGWAFRRLGRSDEAIEAFVRAEEVATQEKDRATAILEQGDTLSEIGRGEEALAKYRLVLEKYPQTPAGEKLKVIVQLRELEAKGRDLFKNYNFAEAQKIFAEVAEKDPSRKQRMDYYAVLCLYGQGLDREAAACALALTAETVEVTIRAEATLWLAKFSYNRRRWKESCRLFSRYAVMRPSSTAAPSALMWAARAAFADNNFEETIRLVSQLAETYPDSPEKSRGLLVQGEALIERARFDEAILVLERVVAARDVPLTEQLRAQILRADALFAMGADNPRRYQQALTAYRSIGLSEKLSPSLKISVSFKLGRTLEKLKRLDDAIDQYYTSVVLAYREGRMKGVLFDDAARAAFSRAAFRLADEYESRGKEFQAMHILELVVASDVPASVEAEKRIDRIQTKGKFL